MSVSFRRYLRKLVLHVVPVKTSYISQTNVRYSQAWDSQQDVLMLQEQMVELMEGYNNDVITGTATTFLKQ